MLDHLLRRLRNDGALSLTLRIRPGARETKVTGVLEDGTIKISVRAAPEHGKANVELIKFLAKAFDVPRGNVELIAGEADRRKIVRITGVA